MLPNNKLKSKKRYDLYLIILELEKCGYKHNQIAELMGSKYKQEVTNAKNVNYSIGLKKAKRLIESIKTKMIVLFKEKIKDEITKEKVLEKFDFLTEDLIALLLK